MKSEKPSRDSNGIQGTERPAGYSFEAAARLIRATTIEIAHRGKEGHLNGALSSVELLLALFRGFMHYDLSNPASPERDRFIFSKGHACASLYAAFAECGLIPPEKLLEYATNNGALPSHPCKHMLPVLDWSSGSLGHGVGVGAGMAYALRLKQSSARVVALISDGECNEGSTWEAATFAATNKLSNLIVLLDYNKIQSIDRTEVLIGNTSFVEKFKAFGWNVQEVDGHDVGAIQTALGRVPMETNKPSVLVAHTIAGKGVSFMENQVLWHYRTPSVEDLSNAFRELNVQQSLVPSGKEASAR